MGAMNMGMDHHTDVFMNWLKGERFFTSCGHEYEAARDIDGYDMIDVMDFIPIGNAPLFAFEMYPKGPENGPASRNERFKAGGSRLAGISG
jgi:hypothetical protein